MFNIYAIQALHGDCTLLEYGTTGDVRYMLIDGGPPTVYANHLRPALVAIVRAGAHLDLAVLTHTDDDHVAGLLDLFGELATQQKQGAKPIVGVNAMWMNSFEFDQLGVGDPARLPAPANMPAPATVAEQNPGMQDEPIPMFDVAEGIDLRRTVQSLEIPINAGFQRSLVSLDTAPPQITFGNLTLSILGPTKQNLDQLYKDWQTWLAKHALPEPAAIPTQKVTPDQSIPNRASIMFLAEVHGKTILVTGDGRGDHLVQGLEAAGLMTKDSVFYVDVLKVPHHGSARNSTRAFYDRVHAGIYLISADGTNGNPDLPTLVDLIESAKAQGRSIVIAATNHTPSLAEITVSHPPASFGYRIKYLSQNGHAMRLRVG